MLLGWVWCQYTVIGWDSKSDLLLLSQGGSLYSCLSASIHEMHFSCCWDGSGVSILWLGKIGSLICNFYLRVAVCTVSKRIHPWSTLFVLLGCSAANHHHQLQLQHQLRAGIKRSRVLSLYNRSVNLHSLQISAPQSTTLVKKKKKKKKKKNEKHTVIIICFVDTHHVHQMGGGRVGGRGRGGEGGLFYHFFSQHITSKLPIRNRIYDRGITSSERLYVYKSYLSN